MEKVTAVASLTHVWVVVDHTILTPAHNKVQDLALIFRSVSSPLQNSVFTPSKLHLLSKTSQASFSST